MSVIQWYPGHMTKALREMEENVKKVDAVIYVLDSRAVEACINPKFEKIIGNKPVLYVFNKADTVEKNHLKEWLNYFDSLGRAHVAANSASGRESAAILNGLKNLLAAKIENYRAKGVNARLRAMVLGIPNSGKSTLINSLCAGKKTATGNKPGVTRGKQWVAVSDYVDLMDTPGTLWPSFDNQTLALHLAFIGSIKDDVLDINEICLKFIEFMLSEYPSVLAERYNLEVLADTPLGVYEQAAKARGYLLKGGEVDYDRTAAAVIDDFRKQRTGRIMLERAPREG